MNPPHQRDKNIIYTSKLLFNLQIHNFMKKTLNINTKNDYEMKSMKYHNILILKESSISSLLTSRVIVL